MLIELQKIEFKGIGRFVDVQTIDFAGRKKLLQIDGKRLDYNGSSGSGKSTVFQAVDYNLGVNTTPATVLQSRLTKDGIWTLGHYLVGPNKAPVIIERGKKDGLSVSGVSPFTNEPFSISGNNAQAEEFIDKIIGIPRDIFKLMTHKRQKDGGFFLKMTPSASYEFMIKALGLGDWLTKAKKASEDMASRVSKIESEKTSLVLLENTLSSLEKEIQGLLTLSEQTSKPEVKDVDSMLKRRDFLLKESQKEKVELDSGVKNIPKPEEKSLFPRYSGLEMQEIAKIKENIEEKREKERKNHSKWVEKLNELRSVESSLNLKLSKEPFLKAEVKDLMVFIKKMKEEGVCPTCEQGWHDEKSKENLVSKIALLKEKSEKLKEMTSFHTELSALRLEIDGFKKLEPKMSDFSEEKEAILLLERHVETKNKEIDAKNLSISEKNRQEAVKYAETVAAIKVQVANKTAAFDREVLFLEQEVESYKKSFDVYEKQIASFNSRILSLNGQKVRTEEELLAKKDSLARAESELLMVQESISAIKSFTMASFSDALEEIGVEATNKLSHISNMSTTTVYFEDFKEKNGKIKEEITPFVSIDADEGIPVRSLSGGERSAIDLAIDLSLVEIIERRGGIGADYFIMDEPFEGLDTECRQNCIELLKNYADSKRIILVDHTEQVKEMVEDRITVVRGTDKSWLET